jgi:uncharacterized membrane protein
METSIFLARILGLYCLIIGLGGLLHIKSYQRIIDGFVANAALVYFSGVFALLLGLLVIQCHNIWTLNWRVIITLIGWMSTLKGMYLIFVPGSLAQVAKFYLKFPILLTFHMILLLVLGSILITFGFIV